MTSSIVYSYIASNYILAVLVLYLFIETAQIKKPKTLVLGFFLEA